MVLFPIIQDWKIFGNQRNVFPQIPVYSSATDVRLCKKVLKSNTQEGEWSRTQAWFGHDHLSAGICILENLMTNYTSLIE